MRLHGSVHGDHGSKWASEFSGLLQGHACQRIRPRGQLPHPQLPGDHPPSSEHGVGPPSSTQTRLSTPCKLWVGTPVVRNPPGRRIAAPQCRRYLNIVKAGRASSRLPGSSRARLKPVRLPNSRYCRPRSPPHAFSGGLGSGRFFRPGSSGSGPAHDVGALTLHNSLWFGIPRDLGGRSGLLQLGVAPHLGTRWLTSTCLHRSLALPFASQPVTFTRFHLFYRQLCASGELCGATVIFPCVDGLRSVRRAALALVCLVFTSANSLIVASRNP